MESLCLKVKKVLVGNEEIELFIKEYLEERNYKFLYNDVFINIEAHNELKEEDIIMSIKTAVSK